MRESDKNRMAFIEHVLADADARYFYTPKQLVRLREEADRLRKKERKERAK